MNGMFTDRVKKVMQLAREESVRLGNDYVGTEHLLLGLIREGDGVAVAVLKNLGIDLEDLARNIEKSISSSGGMMTIGQMIPFTPRAKKVLEIAAQEARAMSHKYIGTEHLLLALMKDHESAAATALANIGVEYDRVKEEIERVKATRAAIGPDINLKLDLNAAYDLPACYEFAKAVAPYNIFWLEEPLHLVRCHADPRIGNAEANHGGLRAGRTKLGGNPDLT